MPLAPTRLTLEQTARLAMDTLHSIWPNSFDLDLTDDRPVLAWEDGPHPSSVHAVLRQYVFNPAGSDWNNALVVADQSGVTDLIISSLPEPSLQRTLSCKFIQAVTGQLRDADLAVTPDDVARVLGDFRLNGPVAIAAREAVRRLSSPLPVPHSQPEFDGVSSADLDVLDVCEMVNDWVNDPGSFRDWDFAAEALSSPELRCVLISLIVEGSPTSDAVPSLIRAIIHQIIPQELDLSAVELGMLLSQYSAVVSDADQGLLPPPLSPTQQAHVELGVFLREITAADL